MALLGLETCLWSRCGPVDTLGTSQLRDQYSTVANKRSSRQPEDFGIGDLSSSNALLPRQTRHATYGLATQIREKSLLRI